MFLKYAYSIVLNGEEGVFWFGSNGDFYSRHGAVFFLVFDGVGYQVIQYHANPEFVVLERCAIRDVHIKFYGLIRILQHGYGIIHELLEVNELFQSFGSGVLVVFNDVLNEGVELLNAALNHVQILKGVRVFSIKPG